MRKDFFFRCGIGERDGSGREAAFGKIAEFGWRVAR